MAITPLESDMISRSMLASKKVLDDLKPVIDQLDIMYNSAGGASTTITQADLDSVPSFSGLTKQQLDDGMYALTVSMKGAVTNSFAALAQLAARI